LPYLRNKLAHFLLFFCIYITIEVAARAVGAEMAGLLGLSTASLAGYSSLYMGLLGAFCGISVGLLNDSPRFYNRPVWQQALLGGTIISLAEFLTGLLLNTWLRLAIWDYSRTPYNLLGQVCLQNCLVWYLVITPFIIWLDDCFTYHFYHEGQTYPLWQIYWRLITLN
jgi:uncharacterized membrane protein